MLGASRTSRQSYARWCDSPQLRKGQQQRRCDRFDGRGGAATYRLSDPLLEDGEERRLLFQDRDRH